jgi:hypothetical protein
VIVTTNYHGYNYKCDKIVIVTTNTAVIVGSYNQYFIKSIDVIDVIVGRYNQYFITSIVIIAVIVELLRL